MHILHETGNEQIRKIYKKWLIFICVLIFICLGIFVNRLQNIKASGFEQAEQTSLSLENGQAQKHELLARSTDKFAAIPSIWPVTGTVTSCFGWRSSPLGEGSEMHPGIDIANSIGTPVVATADGIVIKTGWNGGYGNIVQIDHGNGIETIYGHNSRIAVSVGQNIKKGQIISYVGSTGKSTGPHAHYEVRVNGIAVDPLKFLVMY